MEILQLIDQLEETLNRGWRVPLTDSILVSGEECLRIIDQMRISIPSAIKESERMLAERDRILAEAEAEAHAILAEAEQRAREMVQRDRVAQMAYEEAERIRQAAQAEAKRLILDAEDYALRVLRDLSAQLTQALQQAQNGIRAIEEARQETEPAPPLIPEPRGDQPAPVEKDDRTEM